MNDNWRHLEDFAERFHIEETVRLDEARILFEPIVDFAGCLIDMVRELEARWDDVSGFDPETARLGLQKSAQHLLESVVIALTGMYASSAVIYRLSVEATLQSTYTEEEVLAQLQGQRRAEIEDKQWDLSPADYRRVLTKKNSCKQPTHQLYTVYRTLAKIAHGNLQLFAEIKEHLHSLPRFDPAEAAVLRQTIALGSRATGDLVRARFRSLFTCANLERVARFDRSIEALKDCR